MCSLSEQFYSTDLVAEIFPVGIQVSFEWQQLSRVTLNRFSFAQKDVDFIVLLHSCTIGRGSFWGHPDPLYPSVLKDAVARVGARNVAILVTDVPLGMSHQFMESNLKGDTLLMQNFNNSTDTFFVVEGDKLEENAIQKLRAMLQNAKQTKKQQTQQETKQGTYSWWNFFRFW